MTLELTYVLPLKWSDGVDRSELTAYLVSLADSTAEVIVIDGSEPRTFAANAAAWGAIVKHLAPDSELTFANGKVAGVTTGVCAAGHDKVVIADDDVRYEDHSLARLNSLLEGADLVRPQNYWRHPLPWHATWDSARSLLNRALGADYPGTLGVRRSFFIEMGGYDGDVLFENLELIRTVEGNGGVVLSPLDLYVERLPPSTRGFLGQRVRQAYDELALPHRMAVWLSVVPVLLWVASGRRVRGGAALAGGAVILAETGRRKASGSKYFPATASLLAPFWVLERGVCAWLALLCRFRGGVCYHGNVIKKAANPPGRSNWMA